MHLSIGCYTHFKHTFKYATGPVKIKHVSTKNADFLSLLYHNLTTIYSNRTKSLPLLHH